MIRAALYVRTSTSEQQVGAQLDELRAYVTLRDWHLSAEFIDEGISGALIRRPAFQQMWAAAKRRQFDVLVCWRIDRLGRDASQVLLLLADLLELNLRFVSLCEGIDITIPSGLYAAQMIAVHAQFEREIGRDRIRAGLARARRQGIKLGRPKIKIVPYDLDKVRGRSIRTAAKVLGVSPATLYRRRKERQ